MAKGRKITEDILSLVANVYLENPDRSAKEIRDEVNTRLRRENPKLKSNWPGISATQKILAKIRKNEVEQASKNENELEKPWSVGACVKYNIPSESLPTLLRIKTVWKEVKILECFSIRHAIWIAKLMPLVAAQTKKNEEWQFFLTFIAVLYSKSEQINQLLKRRNLNTNEMDQHFFNGDLDEKRFNSGLVRFMGQTVRNVNSIKEKKDAYIQRYVGKRITDVI